MKYLLYTVIHYLQYTVAHEVVLSTLPITHYFTIYYNSSTLV